MITFELAHFNLAIAKHPLDHPAMAGFASQLEQVNQLARSRPGFVWTPSGDEAGDATTVFGDPLALANMSTWESLGDLWRFTYRGQHGQAVGRRRDWFESGTGPAYVLWWVPAGHRPDWVEAKARLDDLATTGPSPRAFTFKAAFTADGEPARMP